MFDTNGVDLVALQVEIEAFLTDLANANRPANTIRAYRGDLTAFAEHVDGSIEAVDVAAVRSFLSEIADQAPA
ncbi:site-specific integrase, partial [Nocardia cyriacigeorgica]|nr:site-specific integrase [Nocardia cyriacigeorgica]